MDDKMRRRRFDLLFGVRRSIRYHSRRWRFFDRLNQVFSFLFVILGSTAVLGLWKDWKGVPEIAAATVTFAGGIDLVIGTARMSCTHQELMRRFIGLERSIIRIDPATITDQDIREFKATQLDLEADEPPVMRVLDALCHNEVSRAFGYKKNQPNAFIALSRPKVWFAQLINFEVESETIPQEVA